MAIVLGSNQYGKAEVRLVHVDRSTPMHFITDINVTSQLIGDFDDTHLTGANDKIIATDTQKNTAYALARKGGVPSIEEFALRLARNYVGTYDYVTGARMEIEQYAWDRINTAGGPHDHSFTKGPAAVRNTVVRKEGPTETVISGVTGLVVLKSTGSEFHGFPDVPYTSLVETDDRVMATSVSARWLYGNTGGGQADATEFDWTTAFRSVKAIMLEQFALVHSLSLQQTLFAMGRSVLEAHPEIVEIRLSMPNIHHFVVDLSKWDLDNPNMVLYAADRPYGLIEAAVVRDDSPAPAGAWDGVAGFV